MTGGEGTAETAPLTAGARLRAAREARGLDLAAVAELTRVPLRHLHAIELGDYARLPSPTYAVGFSRAFASAVGLSPVEVAAEVRAELGRAGAGTIEPKAYEPVSAARVPPRAFAWTAVAILVLLAAAYLIWRATTFRDARDDAARTVRAELASPRPSPGGVPAATTAAAPVAAHAPVVLVAQQPVWLKVTDRGQVLLQRQLAVGERWDVPATAAEPKLLTGRPDALGIEVAGRALPPLATGPVTVRDVVLTAPALAARLVPVAGAPQPTPSSGPTQRP